MNGTLAAATLNVQNKLCYWLQGQSQQNFGDFLSEILLRELFADGDLPDCWRLFLIGSAIDEWVVAHLAQGRCPDHQRAYFWQCGMRAPSQHSREFLSKSVFCGARGPLTRALLGLEIDTPLGDPALLLPLLHPVPTIPVAAARSLVVPHFADPVTDEAAIQATGCDEIVRPGMAADAGAVYALVDRIATASFVLCGSLHAAVVAAAYGRPFAFWKSGGIDCPFKWADFAASIHVPPVFAASRREGEAIYEMLWREAIRLPPLAPMLSNSPLPAKRNVLEKALEWDRSNSSDHGANSRGLEDSSLKQMIHCCLDFYQGSRAQLVQLQRDSFQTRNELIQTRNELIQTRNELTDELVRREAELDAAKSELNRLSGTKEELRSLERSVLYRYLLVPVRRGIDAILGVPGIGTLAKGVRRRLLLSPPSQPNHRGRPSFPIPSVLQRPAAACGADFQARATGNPTVSIIIPVYGNQSDTVRCLQSIAADDVSGTSFEIIVADDAPADRSAGALAPFNGIVVIENPENLGFLRNCNSAARRANGKYLLFLNNDTLVCPGWLDALTSLAEREPAIGMVGCKLLSADGSVQEAGGIIQRNGWGRPFGAGDAPDKPEYNFVRDVDVVTGACFLVRAEAFKAVGGLDERYAPAFYEEFDLAFAMWERGYRVAYQPAAEVVHRGSASYGAKARDRHSAVNHRQFCKKWAARLPAQPDDAGPPFRARVRNRQDSAPRLLMVDDKVPEFDRHAGALTVYQYLGLMRQLGWHVTYAPDDWIRSEPYTGTLQQMGVEVLYGEEDFVSWLRRNGREIDIVWIARPDVASQWLERLRVETTAKVFYYPHDVYSLREQRRYEVTGDPHALGESKRFRKLEAAIFNRVDCVLTPSADEVGVIRSLAPEVRIEVIQPYLYAPTELNANCLSACDDREALIFVGGFRHLPNVDAAKWLVEEIMPVVWRSLPQQRLLIVGSSPPPEVEALAGPLVEVTGQVSDLVPYYRRSIASVSPLRYGAGVKGKIIASMQQGVPVITTEIGNEGLRLRHDDEALIGSSAGELADCVVRICTDRALWRRLSENGGAVIRDRFSASAARERLQAIVGWRRCVVCGAHAKVAGPNSGVAAQTRNWREEFACERCYALNRTGFLARAIMDSLGFTTRTALCDCRAEMSGLRMHEFGFVGAIYDQLRGMPNFTCSDYFDDVRPGERASNGVLCQDLQRLTFEDQTLDLAISQDVFEHVPDPLTGFQEIYRVLKPGGRHFFTVPYCPTLARSATRARIAESGIEHLLPPQYHGDPIRGPHGALVFTEFGSDLKSNLESIGFRVELRETRIAGVGGGYVVVFETIKPLAD